MTCRALLPALVLLAGCAQAPVDNLPVLRAALSKPPPAELVAPCKPLVPLESRPYNSSEVAKAWLKERIDHAACIGKDAAVVGYFTGFIGDLRKLAGVK